MKNILKAGVLGLFFIITPLLGCQKNDTIDSFPEDFSPELNQMLEGEFQDYFERYDKPIGIAIIVRDADVVHFGQHGFSKDYSIDTQHRAASTAKSFTGAAIMKLYQEGKLDIDHVITDKIPGKQISYVSDDGVYNIPYKNLITIRHLLAHRSGVFDVSNDAIPDTVAADYAGQYYIDYLRSKHGDKYSFTKDELIAPISNHQIKYFAPGKGFHYSNSGYGLLGIIVERVSNLPLDKYLAENFLAPLGMDRTKFVIDGNGAPSDPTMDNYLHLDGQTFIPDFDNLSAAQAEGNLVTTPADLSRWALNLWGSNNLLNEDMIDLMMDAKPTGDWNGNYGLATIAYPVDIGVGHNGGRAGFITVMRYHQETNSAYVAITNLFDVDRLSEQAGMMEQVVRKAIELKSNGL